MARPIPRPVIAQVVVVITAVVVFSGALTILGSSPTSNVAEHAIRSNVTSTQVPVNDIVVTVTPAPEATERPSVALTQAPSPVHGLTAIATAIATVTPLPGQHDMISQPDMEVPDMPANLSGSGSEKTPSFRLETGLTIFDLRHDAPGEFEVRLMRGNNEEYLALLENGLMADEPMSVDIPEAGTYYLDVTADGDWQINVSQPPDGSAW